MCGQLKPGLLPPLVEKGVWARPGHRYPLTATFVMAAGGVPGETATSAL